VGLSAVFFLLFTGRLPGTSTARSSTGTAQTSPGDNPAKTPSSGNGSSGSGSAKPPAPPPKTTPPAVPVFGKPAQLLDAITTELRAGDLENAMKLGGKEFAVLPGTNFLKLLLTKAGYQIPAEGSVFSDAGSISQVSRHALRLEPSSAATPAPAGPIFVNAERDPATAGWKLSGVIISPKLLAQGIEELRRHGIVLDPAGLLTPPDPLSQTHDFLAGVLGRDFRAARLLTDKQKVAQEKLAGLCIVFEEGDYHLAKDRPIVVTAASKAAAIALVRVHSDKMKADAEIGITLHPGADGVWTVEALDFSRLLESYVQQSGAGKVFYSPIVKSPQGGESLVVYFDFNSATLVPRAISQLNIVAGLLATDKARKLRISGHADDLGTDDFNYKLSATRAKNVREHLHKLGVNPAQIETIGFGATAPLDPNKQSDGTDNPEGRSRNRRTEIYLDF
ncbi:MAG: outer membrane protein bacterial, partial [Verrucomicrobiales bacterium]|nr:outer membrane protein bacterial [Verrucomicrobiales bacterium]